MTHLDNCNTSYGQKKGRESNWQFDSRPWEVGNRPDSLACRWCVTHCWKALNEDYNFGLEPHRDRRSTPEVIVPQSCGTLSLGDFETPIWESRDKSHLDATPAEWCRVYYMGEGDGFP
jgi:hypothetical protein